MESNKKPIENVIVDLPETKGIYAFYCKSTLKACKAILQAIANKSYFILVSLIWIVYHNANKLEGIASISTSVHDNIFCKARRLIENCICKFCYAYNQQSYQTGLKEHNICNGFILRNILIPKKVWKTLVILFLYLRIESFGDVANVIQARNYIRIIASHPEKRCAIWSKNLETWKKAFDLEGKPKNTTFVFSSSELNKEQDFDKEKYNFVDHRFTVYTKDYIRKNNIVINCGGKKCLTCILEKKNCYYRNTDFEIREMKK